jgi:hypothetical protein
MESVLYVASAVGCVVLMVSYAAVVSGVTWLALELAGKLVRRIIDGPARDSYPVHFYGGDVPWQDRYPGPRLYGAERGAFPNIARLRDEMYVQWQRGVGVRGRMLKAMYD